MKKTKVKLVETGYSIINDDIIFTCLLYLATDSEALLNDIVHLFCIKNACFGNWCL